MNKDKITKSNLLNPLFFTDFKKASPEALGQILNALNHEIDQALAQKRLPSLEGALHRLGPIPERMM